MTAPMVVVIDPSVIEVGVGRLVTRLSGTREPGGVGVMVRGRAQVLVDGRVWSGDVVIPITAGAADVVGHALSDLAPTVAGLAESEADGASVTGVPEIEVVMGGGGG